MKKIIWGGFCLVAGILLFSTWSSMSANYTSFTPDIVKFFTPLGMIIGVCLSVYGFITGCIGLAKE